MGEVKNLSFQIYAVTIGPTAQLLFLGDRFGPIHDTFRLTVVAKGMEKKNEKPLELNATFINC